MTGSGRFRCSNGSWDLVPPACPGFHPGVSSPSRTCPPGGVLIKHRNHLSSCRFWGKELFLLFCVSCSPLPPGGDWRFSQNEQDWQQGRISESAALFRRVSSISSRRKTSCSCHNIILSDSIGGGTGSAGPSPGQNPRGQEQVCSACTALAHCWLTGFSDIQERKRFSLHWHLLRVGLLPQGVLGSNPPGFPPGSPASPTAQKHGS